MSTEFCVVLTTTANRDDASELAAFIAAHHPCRVPEILQLPVAAGSVAYLQWLAATVSAI